LVPAAACQEPDVHLDSALGALLAPAPLSRRFRLGYFLARLAQPQISRLVGILQRTLRMNAIA